MALSIKTEKADQLARELARLTGRTMTAAVETALEAELRRERAAREIDLVQVWRDWIESTRDEFDWSRPVTKEEWDGLWEEGE